MIMKDAIDNITTKVDLLKYCHKNGINVGMVFFSASDPDSCFLRSFHQ